MRSPSARRKFKPALTFRRALDDLPDDSGAYCACAATKFSDDRHIYHLLEIGVQKREVTATAN